MEKTERSGIFKFFYVLLSIVTFPIFTVLFIIRHPVWSLFFLALIAGGVFYYPVHKGVKPDNVMTWYQQKYQDVKYAVVSNAADSGSLFIPQAVIDETMAARKKMDEEKKEAARPKSENYNVRISRDEKIEQTKEDLKKRRTGFKKAANQSEDNRLLPENIPEVLEENGTSAGGLAALIKSESAEKTNAEKFVKEVSAPVEISLPTKSEKTSDEPEKPVEADELELDLF